MNSDPSTPQRCHPSPTEPGGPAETLVGLATAVTTALSGAYVTTQSVTVTVLVAALIAVLAVCVLRHRPQ